MSPPVVVDEEVARIFLVMKVSDWSWACAGRCGRCCGAAGRYHTRSHRAWLRLFGVFAASLDCVPALWLFSRRLALVGRWLAASGLDVETRIPVQLCNGGMLDLAFWLDQPAEVWMSEYVFLCSF